MQISAIDLALPLQMLQPGGAEQEERGASFSEMLNNALKEINDRKVYADEMTLGFLTGEVQDFHQVAIALQESSLTTQLAIEVRNKIVEAYQEVARMQV